jgi:AIPR protein
MGQNDLFFLKSHFENWLGSRGLGLTEVDPFVYYCIEQFMKPFDPNDEEIEYGITDGPNDGGLDAAYLLFNRDLVRDDTDIQPDSVMTVHLVMFQIKNKEEGFKPTEVDKFLLLTDDLLDVTRPVNKEMAVKYRPDVLDFMKTFKEKYGRLAGYFPQKILIEYFYVTRADETKPNAHAVNSAERVKRKAKEHLSRAECNFHFVNAQFLLNQISARPPAGRELPWSENPIQTQDGYTGLVKLSDFYNFILDEQGELSRRIFESNVRGFQQYTPVNREIKKTLESVSDVEFWLLNNGITILATETRSAGLRRLSLKDPQIVNGLQTSRAIYDYFSQKRPRNDTRNILVRVIETTDPAIYDAVVRATNNQNKMPPAALRATNHIHRQIEEVFRQHGLYYDRRKGLHKDEGKPASKIVSINALLQAVVAMRLQRPDDARARPGDYIEKDEKYDSVFASDLYPLLMYLKCHQLMKKVEKFLSGKQLARGERIDIRFYVASEVACEATNSIEPSGDALSKLIRVMS